MRRPTTECLAGPPVEVGRACGLNRDTTIAMLDARPKSSGLPEYFCGGSYLAGREGIKSGPMYWGV